jgi:hypothetical protein
MCWGCRITVHNNVFGEPTACEWLSREAAEKLT